MGKTMIKMIDNQLYLQMSKYDYSTATLSTPVYLLESVQKNMCVTCEVVANLRNMVLSQYGSPCFKPPPTPATDWTNWPHAVTRILLDRQWESRREILDILGFVLYALALDPS